MDVVERRQLSLRKASKFWHIPITSLFRSLKWETRLRKQRPQGVLTNEKDEPLLAWILGMQECGLLITLHHIKMKVVELTQTKPIPFKNGIPRNSWWYWFKC
jgi:hypothetical protein